VTCHLHKLHAQAKWFTFSYDVTWTHPVKHSYDRSSFWKIKIIVIKPNKLSSLPRLWKSKCSCTILIVTFGMYNNSIFSSYNPLPRHDGIKYKNIFHRKHKVQYLIPGCWMLVSFPQLSALYKHILSNMQTRNLDIQERK